MGISHSTILIAGAQSGSEGRASRLALEETKGERWQVPAEKYKRHVSAEAIAR